jgi:hypothetical protein
VYQGDNYKSSRSKKKDQTNITNERRIKNGKQNQTNECKAINYRKKEQ